MGALFRPLIQARTWKQTLHLLLDLPLGIAWFTVIVTGIALGVGFLPLFFFGLVVLFATLQFVRVVSAVERARASALLDTEIASPFVPLTEIDGWLAKLKAVLADAALWKGVVYCIAMLPIGIFTFTIAVTLWSIALGGLTFPIWGWNDELGRRRRSPGRSGASRHPRRVVRRRRPLPGHHALGRARPGSDVPRPHSRLAGR